jgi:hypothetical protein
MTATSVFKLLQIYTRFPLSSSILSLRYFLIFHLIEDVTAEYSALAVVDNRFLLDAFSECHWKTTALAVSRRGTVEGWKEDRGISSRHIAIS